MSQWHTQTARRQVPWLAGAILVALSLVVGLAVGARPVAAEHGAGGDVIHKSVALVNGTPVEDPDPETGSENVVVTTGDLVTYRIDVTAGAEAGDTEVLVEDVYKPPQQDFVAAADLEDTEIECDLDVGTEDTTVGCLITLDEDGDGSLLLTFEVTQQAPEGEGCAQVTNVATITFGEEVEPSPSNQARIDVCAAAASEGEITIFKVIQLIPNDEAAIFPLPDVGFTLFDAGCEVALTGESFTDDDGVVVFAELEAGTYCLVETSTPEGFQEIEPLLVEVTEAEPAVELTVFNEFEFNFVVVKADCADAEEAALVVFNVFAEEPPELDFAECEPGEATFSLSGSGLAEALSFDVVEIEFFDLDPGTYAISETAPNAVGPVNFEVAPGSLLIAAAINPVAPTPAPPAPTPTPPVQQLPDTAAVPATGGTPAPLALMLVGLIGLSVSVHAWSRRAIRR